jgi:hypothetical protein
MQPIPPVAARVGVGGNRRHRSAEIGGYNVVQDEAVSVSFGHRQKRSGPETVAGRRLRRGESTGLARIVVQPEREMLAADPLQMQRRFTIYEAVGCKFEQPAAGPKRVPQYLSVHEAVDDGHRDFPPLRVRLQPLEHLGRSRPSGRDAL